MNNSNASKCTNILQKSILTLVLSVCPSLVAQDTPNSLNLANKQEAEFFFEAKTPVEVLCFREFDRCEQEFNLIKGFFPEDLSLKEQLIQARVTTMYTIARSSAIHFAQAGDVNKALALLKGLYVKLHAYADPAGWDRLIIEASPTLQEFIKS